MAAETHVQDAAAARKAKEVHVHDGTAVRAAKEVWVHDGVAARKVFQAAAIVNPLPGGTVFDVVTDPEDALARLTFVGNGQVQNQYSAVLHDWFVPTTTNIGNNYWIRATLQSGALSGGDSVGVWLNIGLSRNWQRNRTSPGTSTAQLLIEIATDSGGTNIVTSGTYTLEAQVDI